MAFQKRARVKVLGLGVGMFVGLSFTGVASAQEQKAPPAEKAAETAPLPKGAEILDRFVKETGGKEAYEKIKSIVLTGQFIMPMDMKGPTKIYVVRPNKMLQTVEVPGFGEVQSGSDGETVWSDNPMQGPKILEGEEREMTLDAARISEEANWRDRYPSAETKGVEDVKGKPAFKVELTTKSGQKRLAFYDKETGLLVKQQMTMKSDAGEMAMDILVSDYKKVGDVMLPHKSTMSVMGQEMSTVFDKIEINAEVPDSKFDLPDAVKELKAAKEKKAATPAAPSTTPAPEKK